jgi:putative transposase
MIRYNKIFKGRNNLCQDMQDVPLPMLLITLFIEEIINKQYFFVMMIINIFLKKFQRERKNIELMLIESNVAEDLGKFMKFIAQMYTQYINYFYGRTGTLWKGRFKSSPVSTDNYLLACCRYIEMNPVRAGLVSDAKDYRWSSYCGKIGLKEDKILDFDIWYNSLGDNNLERQKKYQEWFRESIPEYEWKLIRECVNKSGVFGNEKFKEQIEKATGRKMEIRERGRPKNKGENEPVPISGALFCYENVRDIINEKGRDKNAIILF